ncbi:MAG TPA: lipopolysaccharide biosynthesis protein [Steroidobacteraceae bacterium]|jgi:O-antigen/teichoic acid export membrane protein
MDRATTRRLLWSFLSSWVARLSSTIMQLVGVPVFLHFWSVPLYGNWIVVSAIPSYLSFSSVGFGSVAGNEMTMRVARADHAGALRVFQSCWWLIVGLCAAILSLLSGALCFVPMAHVLRLGEISEFDTKWILFYLGVSVLLGQLEMLLQSAYRAVGRNAFGSFCKSAMSLSAFAATMVAVAAGQGPRGVALVFAAANVAGTLILALMVKRDVPWIEFGWRHAHGATIRALLRPALAFMGFPIGNALNLQGTVLAVSYALGPTSVVIFGTARTVSRVALQMVQMVNATFEPEITMAFGAGNIALLRALHRRSCQLALLVSLGIVAAMRMVGPWFLNHWSGGHVPPSGGLLTLLLLVVIVYALWSTSSTVLTATNQHQRLAVYYVAGTSLTCALCYLLARWQGLYGAAASLLASELVMNSYVLPASLRLSHDTLRGFLRGLLHYPASLRPEVLLERFNRARQESEAA